MGLQYTGEHRLCTPTKAKQGQSPRTPRRKEGSMHAFLWFMLGSMFGSFVGVLCMCLVQMARTIIDEEEIKNEEKK